MFRSSHIFRQLGGRKPGGFDIKREFHEHYRDIAEHAKGPQRPAPPHKLPQLVNINKACPPPVNSASSSSNNFDGYKLIGSAFRAHRSHQLKKQQQQHGQESPQDEESAALTTEYVYHDQHCMVIPDAYPKSTFHFLIMPRLSAYPNLKSIADVTERDIPLLRHMDGVSAEIVKAIFSVSKNIPSLARRGSSADEEDFFLKKVLARAAPAERGADESVTDEAEQTTTTIKNASEGCPSDLDFLRDWLFRPRSPVSHLHPVSQLRFMSGCHVLPSLCPLHMHLTSLDMQSDALKNKKHYNTFTTSFFVSRARVEEEISKHCYVKLALDQESLLAAEKLENQSPMFCAWCQYQCKSAPELKKHLVECKSNGCYFVQNTTLASR